MSDMRNLVIWMANKVDDIDKKMYVLPPQPHDGQWDMNWSQGNTGASSYGSGGGGGSADSSWHFPTR